MDIFTLKSQGSTWVSEHNIDSLKTKLWVERYKTPGEFTFTARPTSRLLDQLPLGAFISHINTYAVMMVEDREIVEEQGSEPILTITGRTVDGWLGENRVATDDDQGFAPSLYDGTAWPYLIAENWPWIQLRNIIREQIVDHPNRSSFEINNISVISEVTEGTAELPAGFTEPEELEIKRGSLRQAMDEIMEQMDLGLRVERPNYEFSPLMRFIVYQGLDKSSVVQFNYDAGDLSSARYFWSDRKRKNAAYIGARLYGNFRSVSGPSGFNRRVMYIDASDFNATAGENGWTMGKINTALNRRADRAIAKANTQEILEATISPFSKYKFRVDYNLGDKVFVKGNYGVSKKMRIIEHTEIEDEKGEYSFPTLKPKNS